MTDIFQRRMIALNQKEKWLDWAVELQALAQAGLFYSKDIYDIERFQRIREIAAEMLVPLPDCPRRRLRICSAEKPDIRLPSWTPVPPFFRMTKSCWFRKRTDCGPCPAVGWM